MTTTALELNRDQQLKLFEPLPPTSQPRYGHSSMGRVFLDPEPETLYLGQISIEQHLHLAADVNGVVA